MNHNKRQTGFTLVELMLSMTFISVMLLAIAFCIIQISTIYSRGETLRQVNQASRVLATDLRQTLGSASISSVDTQVVASHGRLCTGMFSYIWNVRDVNPVNPEGVERYENNRFENSNDEQSRPRFMRIVDAGGQYCQNPNQPLAPDVQAVELLETGDRSLKVRRLSVTPALEATATGQRLYVFTVTLGTDRISEIDTTTDTCRPPADASANATYCAVNHFSLTIRAGTR